MKDKYTGVELDEVAGHSWIIDGYVIATLDDESHNVHVKDFMSIIIWAGTEQIMAIIC